MSVVNQKDGREKLWREFELLFLERRWDKIRHSWLDSVPLIEPAGHPPPIVLSNILDTFFSEGSVQKGLLTVKTFPRAEIPEIVFREAIYWLHKAVHVLGASEKHIENGLPTWSLSSGYQSAFFAARSILAFHGIAVGEHDRASIVVDLCRDSRGESSRKLDQIGAFEDESSFRATGYLFGHKEIWSLFQRLLRVVKRTPWPNEYVSYFKELDLTELSHQRHNLHYNLDYWVMDDLCQTVFDETFAATASTGKGKNFFDSKSRNFSVTFGFTLSQMAMFLFVSMCQLTNRLVAEDEMLKRILVPERHPFFAETVRPNMHAPD